MNGSYVRVRYNGSRLVLFATVSLLAMSCAGPATDRTAATSKASDTEKRLAVERMAAEYHAEYPEVPELTVDELEARLKEKRVLLVDVRPEAERSVSIIPGAISIDTFNREKPKHRDDIIVTYCTIGYRSGKCAEQLRAEGLDAYNLRGSILAWVQAQKRIVDANGAETNRVHVYSEQWNLVPEGYTPVW